MRLSKVRCVSNHTPKFLAESTGVIWALTTCILPVCNLETCILCYLHMCYLVLSSHVQISAVINKCFVNKIGDKTAMLRKYDMSTKDSVLST